MKKLLFIFYVIESLKFKIKAKRLKCCFAFWKKNAEVPVAFFPASRKSEEGVEKIK